MEPSAHSAGHDTEAPPERKHPSTAGRRKAIVYPARAPVSTLLTLIFGVLCWALVGPFLAFAIDDSAPLRMSDGPWIPNSMEVYGILLATVGAIGIYIGTREWRADDRDYRVSLDVLLALFVLEAALFATVADTIYGAFLAAELNLVQMVMVIGGAVAVSHFAQSQTASWHVMVDQKILADIRSSERALERLERPYTHVGPGPAGELPRGTARVITRSALPAVVLAVCLVSLAPLPAGDAVSSTMLALGLLSFVALSSLSGVVFPLANAVGRHRTPWGGEVPGAALLLFVSEMMLLLILVLFVSSTDELRALSGAVAAVITVAHAVTAIAASFSAGWAMRLLGVDVTARYHNALAREKLEESIRRLRAAQSAETDVPSRTTPEPDGS